MQVSLFLLVGLEQFLGKIVLLYQEKAIAVGASGSSQWDVDHRTNCQTQLIYGVNCTKES